MVELIQGKRERLSLAEESVYGTEPATYNFSLGRNAVFEPTRDRSWQEILGAGTDTIAITRERGPKVVGGTLTFAPQDWRWLKFVLSNGSAGVANSGSNPYTHTFTNSNIVKSFSLERALQHTATKKEVYKGCQVNTATISWDAGTGEGTALMRVALNLMIQNMTLGTGLNGPTPPSTAAYQFRNSVLTLNSSEIVEILGGSMTVDLRLHDARYANFTLDELKGESAAQARRVNGTFRVKYSDHTYHTLWDNGVVIPGTNTLLFKRAPNDQGLFTFTNLRFHTMSDPTNLGGSNDLTIAWSADDVTFVSIDAIASY